MATPAADTAAGSGRVLVDGLDHPEGVAYDPAADVVWCGGEAGQLYRVDVAAGTAEQAGEAFGFVLGVAVDGRGRVAACCSHDGSVAAFDPATGRARRVVTVTAGDGRLAMPNFPAFLDDGTLFVSDSGRWGAGDGRLVRVDRDGTAEVFSRAVGHFTNGLAVSPDGRWLWVAESHRPRLSRLDLRTGDGRAEVVAELPGTVPDGLAFTDAGGLLVACYRPDAIFHLDRCGELELVASDPQRTLLAGATNVCFVGPGLDRVVSANLGRWHLTLLDLGLRGAPLPRPARWAADAG